MSVHPATRTNCHCNFFGQLISCEVTGGGGFKECMTPSFACREVLETLDYKI